MANVHLTVGVAVIALNLIAGAWGGVAWLTNRPAIHFWHALRIAQVAVVAQVSLGAILVFTGHEPADGLHYVYGIAPLLVSLLAEAARGGAAEQEIGERDFETLPAETQRHLALAILRRETGIMAVSALVIFGLALRAAFTAT